MLAMAQTEIAIEKIRKKFPALEIEIVPMSTKGDQKLDQSLASFGGKGVFTKELEMALLSGDIDMAVHSAKDMPMILPDGLMIGGVIERADARDVLVTKDGTPLASMKKGTVIGTGSLRRELQLKRVNPDIEIRQIRGNVQTRLQKLADGQYDAIVLAAAGLERLNGRDAADLERLNSRGAIGLERLSGRAAGGSEFLYEFLDTEMMLPAAGQAIIAVEVCEKNTEIRHLLETVSDMDAWRCLEAERRFLECIGGSCNAPAAALAQITGSKMSMTALYVPEDTGEIHKIHRTTSKINGYILGEMVAKQLLDNAGNQSERIPEITWE